MRFGARLPNDTATLLLLAVFIIVLLGLSAQSGDRASHHAVAISIIGAACLLGVYGAWLWSYLRMAATQATHDAPAEAVAPRCGSASRCWCCPAPAPRSSPTGSSPRSTRQSTRSGSRRRSRGS